MQRIKKITLFLLTSLAFLYTIGYLSWRGLLLSPLYETSWQLQLSEVFGAWIYLLLVPLILLMLVTHRWRALAVLGIPLAFFLWEYGAQFLPNWQHGLSPKVAQAQSIDDETLSVLTWNMYLTAKVDDDFYQILREEDPDILTLQEVSYAMRRVLQQDLKEAYPYQYYQHYGKLASLSRYPLSPTLEESLTLYGCLCLPLELSWQGRSLTIINIHMPSPDVRYSFRRKIPRLMQYDRSGQDLYHEILLKLLTEIEGPILLNGDLNTTERQRDFKNLTETLTDSFAEAGWGMGFTYPNVTRRAPPWLVPLVQIDHILHSDELVALTADTVQLRRSDHRAVTATLRWRE